MPPEVLNHISQHYEMITELIKDFVESGETKEYSVEYDEYDEYDEDEDDEDETEYFDDDGFDNPLHNRMKIEFLKILT